MPKIKISVNYFVYKSSKRYYRNNTDSKSVDKPPFVREYSFMQIFYYPLLLCNFEINYHICIISIIRCY